LTGPLCVDDRTGILLVGHGTRSAAGTAQFLALADHLTASLAPAVTQPAFLELQSPDIDAAIGRLVARGIDRLITVPLLLFTAGHARHDIPQAVGAALSQHGAAHLPRFQTAAFGCHEALVRLSNLRLEEALRSKRQDAAPQPDAAPPLCVVVGRGSRDDEATAQMYEFVRHKQGARPGIQFEVAFAALAQPLLADLLPRLAASDRAQQAGQVIIQPHLLFAGEIVDRIARQTAEAAALCSTSPRSASQGPAIEWLIAPVLAPAVAMGLPRHEAADSTHLALLEQVIRDSIVAAVSHS
jgi:sirohydrochlorin cobaltochelatase